ncbi:Hypothetical predicted protein [Paramuricea clavata]|uniref:Uncharacterized protein n=1 Tax=Paramuricea clavata TaxID=317549 RepID=A0A6S7GP20_PARCT|nr:Hypothetical predicted protein [Paramuricea clavata]
MAGTEEFETYTLDDGSVVSLCDSNLVDFQDFSIPRFFKLNLKEELYSVRLHCLSDASRPDYGAVLYLRIVDVDGLLNVSFVVGKSRESSRYAIAQSIVSHHLLGRIGLMEVVQTYPNQCKRQFKVDIEDDFEES